LPSGKILWLCPKHQQEDDRITVLPVDENLDAADPDESAITASMLDVLNEDKNTSEARNTDKSTTSGASNKDNVITQDVQQTEATAKRKYCLKFTFKGYHSESCILIL
jgi:hypothetical protein